MTVPDTFRLNAYRVLRILASASAPEIQKAADSMRRAGEPGLFRTSEIDMPGLGDVPRGDADIRAAAGRLANPAQRLTDRLFWFCELPAPASVQRTTSAMDPTGHDGVLRALFDAMQGGLDDAGLAAWVKALRAWHAVVSDDDYWFLALVDEEQGSFEPAATSLDVDTLRAGAVRIAAEPLMIAAHGALAADDRQAVQRALTALSSLTDTGPWARAAMEEIATPASAGPVNHSVGHRPTTGFSAPPDLNRDIPSLMSRPRPTSRFWGMVRDSWRSG